MGGNITQSREGAKVFWRVCFLAGVVLALVYGREKLADYLDYLHMQRVKAEARERLTLAEVKEMRTVRLQVPPL